MLSGRNEAYKLTTILMQQILKEKIVSELQTVRAVRQIKLTSIYFPEASEEESALL